MNMNFVSVESLMNEDVAMPIQDPVPDGANNAQVAETPGKPVPRIGNLITPPADQEGHITSYVDDEGATCFHCNVGYEVRECMPYYSLIHLLDTATENDKIYIDIYSYGGEVETGCHIISAMERTKAHVVTTAYGLCCSIGAMIWVYGNERRVTPNSTIMFHMPSGGVFGKTSDNQEESQQIHEWFVEIMRKIAEDVLTEEEYQAIVDCRNDLFIPAETMAKRLESKKEAENAEK